MKTCVLCKRRKPGSTFFKFPTDPILKEKWIKFCEQCVSSPTQFYECLTNESRLCDDHFDRNFISLADGVLRKRTTVDKSAVPSILPHEDNLRDCWQASTSTSTSTSGHKKKNKFCYVCGERSDNVQYFGFRNKWKPFFPGEVGLTKNVMLCEKHFNATDIQRRGFKTILIEGAIPILAKESKENEIHSEVSLPNLTDDRVDTIEKNCVDCTVSLSNLTDDRADIIEENYVDCTVHEIENEDQDVQFADCAIELVNENKVEFIQCDVEMVNESEVDLRANSTNNNKNWESNQCNELANTNEVDIEVYTPEKSNTNPSTRFKKPRYVGDISTPHFSTPRSARYCIRICKKTLFKKDAKIKIYRDRERRFKKKICTLEKMVTHLHEEKNLISEQAKDMLTVRAVYLDF